MPLSDLVSTVARIRSYSEGRECAAASGFFYFYSSGLYLCSSRRIVTAAAKGRPDELRVLLHTDPDDPTQNEELAVPLFDEDGDPLWLEHTSRPDEIELIAVPLDALEIEMRFAVRAFSILDQVPKEVELPPGEDVLVIGFPEGVYDDVHNLPVVRRASIASVYPVPYKGRPQGLLDVRLPSETHGAPVVTRGSLVSGQANDGSSPVEKPVNYFVGVHSSGGPGGAAELDVVWYPWLLTEIINQES